MVKKIALEEHVLTPGLIDYWRPTMTEVPPALTADLFKRLTDFGDLRLETMDKSGIARAVLSVSGPGVQAERDAAVATRKARESNDFLAVEIQKRPDRYAGFAHIAVQDPKSAADELERCVRDLGFKGAMINGHTHGQYLDHPSLAPFWERAEALDAVVYIHPTDPITPAPVLDGVPALRRATWEWGFETGSHALRLVFSGLFDRYPKAKVALGHMGETLPYLLWRFDSRAKLYNVKLAKPPSQYIKDNIVVTVSGVFAAEPLRCAVDALGRDKVMFGADYPFEDAIEAGHFLDTVPIEESLREDIAYNNAAKLLNI
ncbi:MAG: amidohydrolase family protein [Pseudolabrys sp.]|nr:amidohydrolase family protein [Pseudolabrys sp.]MDP2293982.1 amidohydrolase family protein [Pseudolabrys sp.]